MVSIETWRNVLACLVLLVLLVELTRRKEW
ncbi:hypothetical protein BH10CHL1_BH10CHL1_17990 [soil metagenome]